jgi:hypothetical protein
MKVKLLLLLSIITLSSSAQTTGRVNCLFYSHVVTNWVIESTPSVGRYTIPTWVEYSPDIKSAGMSVGTVSSNYTASIVLAGTTNYITISSIELFKIYRPWKEVYKTETVYDKPYLRTNTFNTTYAYTNTLGLTNYLSATNYFGYFHYLTNSIFVTNYYNVTNFWSYTNAWK